MSYQEYLRALKLGDPIETLPAVDAIEKSKAALAKLGGSHGTF